MHYALHYSHADSALLTKHLPKYGAIEADECRVGICLVGTADDHLSVCSAERQSADDGVSYQRMEILPLLVGAATQHEPHHTPQPQLRHDLRRLRQRRLLRYRQIASALLVCSARRIALVGCCKPRLCVFRLITCRLRRYQDSLLRHPLTRHPCHLLFYSHSCKNCKIKQIGLVMSLCHTVCCTSWEACMSARAQRIPCTSPPLPPSVSTRLHRKGTTKKNDPPNQTGRMGKRGINGNKNNVILCPTSDIYGNKWERMGIPIWMNY